MLFGIGGGKRRDAGRRGLPVAEVFEVKGTHEFAVGSFMMGGQVQDPPNGTRGDPAFSLMVSTAQLRKKYIFLAPTDYDVSYADIFIPPGAQVTLDGAPLSGESAPIGASGWSIVRRPLDAAGGCGAHTPESDREVAGDRVRPRDSRHPLNEREELPSPPSLS
jgi:IgGFc binding protein